MAVDLVSAAPEWTFLGLKFGWLQAVGLLGNAAFSMRFLVQWIASEKQGESVIPIAFWYWGILGTLILCGYFIAQRDPVGILAYLPNAAIYVRNLALIRKKQRSRTVSPADPDPQG
ncbi:MAG TPA: lipid-A-disaccharide synthase N-terminal domain-containing protein [Planctomycetota bacterium]|jgi:lipid-A-disaccharide synthase-like uncharacterized protein|nr:lipid-A-disaccharide synthase N-terminal domain-containing protein [Planctomycetota bacterium]